MPVKFVVEMVKGLFGVSEQRESDQAELSQTNITVEREPDEAEDSAAEDESESDEAVEEEEAAESTSEEEPSGDPVGEISGIGPTYSERLADIGVETVGDLAAADATEVGDAAEVSESRATDWISQAKDW